MKPTLFSNLCELIGTGYRFKQEEISVIKASMDYHQATSAEQIFIEGLLKNFAEMPAATAWPAAHSSPPQAVSPPLGRA